MATIDWKAEVSKRQEDLLKDLQGLLKIESVLDEKNSSEDAPLGKTLKQALDYMLALGEKDGFFFKKRRECCRTCRNGQRRRADWHFVSC